MINDYLRHHGNSIRMSGVHVDNTIRITVHNKERFGKGGGESLERHVESHRVGHDRCARHQRQVHLLDGWRVFPRHGGLRYADRARRRYARFGENCVKGRSD